MQSTRGREWHAFFMGGPTSYSYHPQMTVEAALFLAEFL